MSTTHPADVVVAHELHECVRAGVGVGEPVVVGEHRPEPVGGPVVGHRALHGAVEAEVEGGRERQLGAEAAGVVGVAGEDLAEHHEVALHRRVRLDGRDEGLPELVVHVLHGVHAEAVDPELGDHRLVGLGHAGDHVGMLGEEVVEAEEVAVERALAGERRVAAVVVVDRVVEEVRRLDRLVGRGLERRDVREADGRVERRERAGAGVVAVVELDAVGVPVRVVRLVAVRVLAAHVLDHVAGVVGHHVEVDLHAERVGGGDEVLHLLVGAEVRVDGGEVHLPVAVVAGRDVGARALDPAVRERRGDPQRGDAEALEVAELALEAGQVAAVVEALVGGEEPVLERVGRGRSARGRWTGRRWRSGRS
jgi:hypothetical protein